MYIMVMACTKDIAGWQEGVYVVNGNREGYSYIVVTAHTGIVLFMRPANERWCYIVTSSLIGWVHKQNDPII